MTRLQVSKWQVQIMIGLAALAGVLLYNWTHTGGLLAGYVRPDFIGYIAAAGIELAIVGLSLRIADLRKQHSDARFFVATLIAVVVVSALANIAEGYNVKFGEVLTLANIGRLDIVQAVVSLAATGLLSLVTFALAEIVGGDVTAAAAVTSVKPDTGKVDQFVADVTQRLSDAMQRLDGMAQQVTEAQAGVTGVNLLGDELRAAVSLVNRLGDDMRGALESVNQLRADMLTGDNGTGQTRGKGETDAAKAQAIDALIAYATGKPDASVSELAKVIGRSRATVYNYLDELEQAGRLHRNGQITVLDTAQG